ncbi:hypothetical protein ABK040_009183 [Willaertia magna]
MQNFPIVNFKQQKLDNNKQDTIHLSPTDLSLIKENLEKRGWIFIQLPAEIIELSTECILQFKELLQNNLQFQKINNLQKDNFLNNYFGFIKNNIKEGFRMLTGTFLQKSLQKSLQNNENKNFIEKLIKLGNLLDNLSINFMKNYCKDIFNISFNELCQLNIYPLFTTENNKNNQQQLLQKNTENNICDNYNNNFCKDYCKDFNNEHFSLLDIAKYTKTKDKSIIVHEHSDPGLFSFSLQSTQPGLQLFDPINKEWINVPNNISVLWCGLTANEITNGKISCGFHRVIQSNNTLQQLDNNVQQNNCNENNYYNNFIMNNFLERITMWYEVCAKEQISNKFLQSIFSLQQVQLQLKLKGGTENDNLNNNFNNNYYNNLNNENKIITVFIKTITGMKVELKIEENSTGYQLKRLLEEKVGIPPPKQRIVFKKSILGDDCILSKVGIEDQTVLHLVLSLRGGKD